ncbi:hypothetical protein DUNSADRAFT_18185 [Dunaliella salina]|uniref:FAD-binding domain-containing protein n=1 Tax=Dunaliella salina TaxID=3046 RepID=A0ABQ7G0I5_DUNSA|nr:hypothetical protein DUNSADRAFT_18185 [Dunaliella salina]|eukprot:KAF5828115.1 hypothetical protein DUNSADRAFT_18185 [Dunaliella salina]
MLVHSTRFDPNSPLTSCPQHWATASKPPVFAIHLERPASGASKPWVLKQPTAYSKRRQRIAHVFQQDADVVPETNDEWDDEDDRAVPSATKIVVVGAGPIGLLSASYFARRGYNVDVFERRPHPALRTANPAPDHPVVLSSRALLAFKELGMHTSFAAPDANPHKGTFDMASGGRLAPANPGHPYRGTVVTSKHRLEAEILQEMRRKYPTLIKVTYGAELVTADFDARKAIVTMQEGSQGSPLHVQGCRSRGPGNMLLVSATRPSGDPATAIEELVPYDLLIGADGADSIVRERMVQAKSSTYMISADGAATSTEEHVGQLLLTGACLHV